MALENNKNKGEKIPNTEKKNQKKFNIAWLYIGITLIFFLIYMQTGSNNFAAKEVYNTKVKELVTDKEIDHMEYVRKDDRVNIFIKSGLINNDEKYKEFKEGNNIKGPHFFIKITDYKAFVDDITRYQDEAIANAIRKDSTIVASKLRESYDFDIKQNTSHRWGGDFFFISFMILITIFFIMQIRAFRGGANGGGMFSIGKSKAQLFDSKKQPSVSFKDVAGLEGAKYEVEEIVDFLKNPKKYTTLGGKIPKGALLVGPPGTGKTLLAKAVAGEAQVPFFSLSGSDFVEMFVGVGASRVRDLFKNAKEKAPCIIFIDEIDAIGRSRGRNSISGANDERENTLNQLLTEMDGFSTNNGIIVLAATNRADVLDRALLRAGRFDRQIHVELPNYNERKGIFEVHVRNLKLAEDVDLEFFSKQTPGFSGADIANVCNEAALIAARNGKQSIEKSDFLAAIDRIIGGLEKRGNIISPDEKKTIAIHESGHATVSWMLKHASPLVKVTIVPRGKSLGAAWYLPEERHITTTEQLMDEMAALLGGRAAEEVLLGKVSTGALNDLERATKQAYAMVVYYGLSKLGNISYYDSSGEREYNFSKPYSEKTAEEIDREVHNIIDEAYQTAKKILSENKDKLTQLSKQLQDKEVIFTEDMEKIYGKRTFETENIEQPKVDKNTENSENITA
jgi:cell division protease FtsH